MTQLTFTITNANDMQSVYRISPPGGTYPPSGNVGYVEGNPQYATRDYLSPGFNVYNLLFRWNTAAIPDNAVITSATLHLEGCSANNAESRSFVLEYSTWNGVSASDHSNIAPSNPIGSIPLANVSPNSAQNISITNFAGISNTGITYIRGQISGGAPNSGGSESRNEFWTNSPGANSQLIVDYVIFQGPAPNWSSSFSAGVATFTDQSTDPDGTITSRLWDFGDNTSSTTQNPTHVYAAYGWKYVTLYVTDSNNVQNYLSRYVWIPDKPVALFTVSGTGLTRTFTNTSTADYTTPVASSLWNFGDNTPTKVDSGKSNATHQFQPGTYNVTLTVTDSANRTSVKTQSVVIATPVAPPQPSWRNLAQFQVVPTNFTFQGYMFTSTSESPISLVHLQIARADTGAMAYDAEFEITPQEGGQGFWARAPVALDPAVTYKTKFRTKDHFNQYSQFSIERTFDVSIGPDPPTLTAPLGKINVISGFNYQGTYSHADLLAANAVQIEVRTPAGTTIIHDSGTLAISVANGAAWSIADFHPDLSWATKYTWKARLRDTANAWGPYSLLRAFNTNSPPRAPTGLSPANGAVTDSRVFSCALSDPDGDAITAAQIEISRVSTGAVIAGYPKQMTVAADGASATFTAPTTDLVLGVQYRFRCRGTDGLSPGYGAYSNYATFTYQAAPTVSLRSPSAAQRKNLVSRPSAEYDDAVIGGAFWTELNRGGMTGKNLLTANQSSVESDLTGWTAFVATITRSTLYVEDGNYSVAMVANSGANGAHVRLAVTSPLPNTQYSWQARVYLPISTYLDPFSWALVENGVSGPTFARAAVSSGAVLYPSGWNTLSGSGTTSASPGTSMTLFLRSARLSNNTLDDSTKTIYFDKVQVEQSATPTTWELGSSGVGAGTIDAIGDGDGAFGSYAWRGVESATSTNTLQGSFMTVSATVPYLASAYFKKESGLLSKAHFRVLCYNASNVLLGTLYPSSIAACNDANIPGTWTRYGGIVWPSGSSNSPSFPSGTTKVRLEILPSRTSLATIRFDAVSFEQAPLLLSTEWPSVQPSFGYFDGDEPGERYGVGGYQWSGVPGDSQSIGLNIQSTPTMWASISYSSAAGAAKSQDRITLESWDISSASWVPAYTSLWVTSARTLIPLPNVLRNERRYRLLIEVKDVNGAIGNSGYVEFDARFEGPVELKILVAEANPANATIDLTFQATALSATQFGGIEIMVRPSDNSEPASSVALLKDRSATRFSYQFPVSGREYEISVKQLRITGLDLVGSRWSRALVTCTYPYPFLKEVSDTSLYLTYDVPPQSYEQDAPVEKFIPWGSVLGIHAIGEVREKSGTEEIALYEELGVVASADERFRVLKQILERRRTICLLTQTPEPEKIFAAIIGRASFGLDGLRKKSVSFDWEETTYPEDVYERGDA